MPDPWGYTDPNDIWANDNSGRWQQFYEQWDPSSQFITGQDNKQYPNPNYQGDSSSGTPDGESPDGPRGIYKGIDIDALPDWLKPHSMHDFIHELKTEYKGTKKAYNVNDEIDKYLAAANSGYAMSLQQGNNIASETAARAYQSGVPGQVNTGAIAAQFALPALQGRVDAEAKAAGIKTSAAQSAAQARAALAAAISGARNQYANTLATFRGQNLDREKFMLGLNEEHNQFQQKLQFDRDQLVSPLGGSSAQRGNVADIIKALTSATALSGQIHIDPESAEAGSNDQFNEEYRRKIMQILLGISGEVPGGLAEAA